ncbi:hypothetical protein [Calothrix sp. PCC 7507]|uniref:hypothetical protein n=1 Tax=Calothrix sp. PCC 7507 TaxID=99598 RepID=UPI00029EE91C|nr:hypothetical protein [Calothrix sp. PCC 7507]AFY36117.1 hypothetical protein Cal7507_5801 [Calothrix sp. PCC 7507]
MKISLLCALTIFSVLGISHQAKAYNAEACLKNPMANKPQTINLLQPIDQKIVDCIPRLDSIASQWQSQSRSIASKVNRFTIGNQGNTSLEKLEYNVVGNTIYLVAKIRPKHTWSVTIPATRMHVPVTKYREVSYCVTKIMGTCIGFETKKMPYVVMELQTVTPASTVSKTASVTCNYEYTFNLSTKERKPGFKCGQGWTGNIKLDASAITSILNGEIPGLGSLISNVDMTPPLLKDVTRDEYTTTRDNIIAQNPNSIVYFASESFVNWASVKTQAANVILTALSGGGYSAEFLRELEEKLRTELMYMSNFASQTAINLSTKQILSMIQERKILNLDRYTFSVKVVDTPQVQQKCVVNRSECTPPVKLSRLGFAIIATPSK